MNFIDDKEKMRDFTELSKDEFLKSYSYLSEKDYLDTQRVIQEKSQIANVWYIDGNELKNGNKVISKIIYDGQEFAILKSKRNWVYADMLIKDKDNVYWELGIAPIKFDKFVSANIDNTIPGVKEYCNDIKKAFNELDFESFFEKQIDKKGYFNKCELKYISKYYPNLYERAKECRENFLQEKEKERQEERKQKEKAQNEEMDTVNEIFENKVAEMKTKIHLGEIVVSEDYEYYKEYDYYNGRTYQNNFLYLAKEYGIDIPLATKGFINNRLVNYNFGTGLYYIKRDRNNNNKGSTKIRECFEKIKDKVDEEYQRNKKISKDIIKNKEVLGGDK